MSWLLGVLILSLIVRLVALGWSLVLVLRTEYRYVGALTLLLVLITLRDALLMGIDGPLADTVESLATAALVALLISLAALGSVFGFSQVCAAQAVAEQQIEAVRAGQIGSWRWDVATNQLHIDSIFKHLLGYEDDEIPDPIGDWKVLVLPEDRQLLNEHITRFLATTNDFCELRSRVRHKQGHPLPVLIRGRAVRNSEQVAQRLFGIATTLIDEAWIADVRESEQRLYQVTDAIKEVFWLATADQSRTLYVNRAYETVWGRSRERLYAHPGDWLEAVIPEDRERVARLMLHGGGTYDVEYRIQHPDGSIRWIHDRGFPVLNAQGDVYRLAGLAEDVTRWKEADQQLRLIQTAVDQINDAVCITTAELDPPGPQIVYVNPAFTRMTGYSAAEVLGKTPRILQGPKTDRRVLDQLREALSQQRSYSGEVINYRKDGTEFWLRWHIAPVWDEAGRLTHWFAVQRDVSEQRRAAEALRDSERRYRLLAEYSTDLVSRHDPNGVCLFVSPSARTVLGYEPDALMGKRTLDFVHPEDMHNVQRTVGNLSDATDQFQVTCRVRRRDGRYVWLESIGRVVRDPQTGTIVESIVQSRDITERRAT